MKVYLCGPIFGCTDEECKDWRQEFKTKYPNSIDPMERDFRGNDQNSYQEIVDLDKRDIRRSDVILVNYTKPSVGTSMEIYYAWTLGKSIIIWLSKNTPVSPWIRYHSTTFVSSLDAAIEKLKEWK